MTRNRRLLTYFAVGVLVVVLGWVALIGLVYALGGVATVQVRDGRSGDGLYLPVPAVLIEAALVSTRWIGPAHHDFHGHLAAELGDLPEAITAALEALEECPDATLVEVLDGQTSVRVEKAGRALRIEVWESDGSVTVSLPVGTVRRSVGRLIS